MKRTQTRYSIHRVSSCISQVASDSAASAHLVVLLAFNDAGLLPVPAAGIPVYAVVWAVVQDLHHQNETQVCTLRPPHGIPGIPALHLHSHQADLIYSVEVALASVAEHIHESRLVDSQDKAVLSCQA